MTPSVQTPPRDGAIATRTPLPMISDIGRVLIIDDHAGIATVLRTVLRRAGLSDVEIATDPVQGIELFTSRPPDLVLLDVNMPTMSGFDVLEHIRSCTRDEVPVPVVMLTGDQDQSRRTHGLALGASDFLSKPFDTTEVLLRVRALLETRSLQRRLAEQNRELERRVAERTRELEASQAEVLARLAVAAELRDDETGQHTQRVGELAGRLARALGLPAGDALVLAQAAQLHDIGKIGVADAILRKPGRLTFEEIAEMRKHAEIGARILSGGQSPVIQVAERIARHHHERWDGSGYPGNLVGEAIPLEARIVAVVDFFDALTHERPYRGAIPVEQTLEMILADIGIHFDPRIARTFVAMIRGTDDFMRMATSHFEQEAA